MSVSLSPLFNGFQSFLASGLPNNGGFIYTYSAGTTTPLATYTTVSGGVANSNPIILSADGRPPQEIWMTDGSAYKFFITDALGVGLPNSTFDNITGFVSAAITGPAGASIIGGSAQVVPSIAGLRALLKTSVSVNAVVTGYYAAGDGGGGTYYYDSADTTSTDNGGTIIVATDGGRWKLVQTSPIRIKQFGAKCDGTTDDTAAVNSAITAAANKVLIIDGTPLISSTITISSKLEIRFDGGAGLSGGAQLPSCYLIKKSTMTTPGITFAVSGVIIRNGGVVGQVGNSGDGIYIPTNDNVLDSVMVYRAGGNGIRIGSDTAGANANTNILTRVVSSFNNGCGIYIHDVGNNANANSLIQPFCQSNAQDGIRFGLAAVNTILGPLVEQNTIAGLHFLSTAYDNQIFGGDVFEGNVGGNVVFDGGSTGNKILALPAFATGGISDAGTNNYVQNYSVESFVGNLSINLASLTPGLTTVVSGLPFFTTSLTTQGHVSATNTVFNGFYGNGLASVRGYSANTAAYSENNNNCIAFIIDNANYAYGLITSATKTSFTITWSVVGVLTGTGIIQYLARR